MTACTNGARKRHSGTAFSDESCPLQQKPLHQKPLQGACMSAERPLGDGSAPTGHERRWATRHQSSLSLLEMEPKIEKKVKPVTFDMQMRTVFINSSQPRHVIAVIYVATALLHMQMYHLYSCKLTRDTYTGRLLGSYTFFFLMQVSCLGIMFHFETPLSIFFSFFR